jgi:hypothetical protein
MARRHACSTLDAPGVCSNAFHCCFQAGSGAVLEEEEHEGGGGGGKRRDSGIEVEALSVV